MKHVKTFLCALGMLAVLVAVAKPQRANLGSTGIDGIEAENYTVEDYVQDGLVHLMDGIDNIGIGEHDSEASYWLDLVSGEVVSFKKGSNAWFTDNSLHRENALGDLKTNIPFPRVNTTIQVVCSVQGPAGSNARILGSTDINHRFEFDVYDASPSSAPRMYYKPTTSSGAQTQYLRFVRKPLGLWTLTVVFLENSVIVYDMESGSIRTSIAVDYGYFVPYATRLNLGAWYSTYGAMTGDFFAVRVYDRALTMEEIRYNDRVDRERFGL